MKDTNLIIDFDSTFVTIETLDELAQISIGDDQDSVELIKHITHKAMAGELDFCDALSRRIEVLSPVKKDIEKLIIDIESNRISPSFAMNKEFINTYRENIYIVSGGFREVINPIVSLFGISEQHVFANSFVYDNENVVGYNKNEVMSTKPGKIHAVRNLCLPGRVVAIGDGYTDFQIKESGEASDFIAYTESVFREGVVSKADYIASSFDDVISYIS